MREAGVNIVLRNAEGEFLFQFRDLAAPTDPLSWDFFGGAAEGSETAEECTKREIAEELGLSPLETELRLLWSERMDGVLQHFILYVPILRWNDFTLGEGAGAAFLSPEEATAVATSARMKRFLERLAEGGLGLEARV